MQTFIGKTQLAMEMSPDSDRRTARALLMRSIKNCPELYAKLLRYGYRDTNKLFTPKQAALIREYLIF